MELTRDELITLYYASTAHITCDLTVPNPADRYSVGGLGRHARKSLNCADVAHLYRCGFLSTRDLKDGERVPDRYPYAITPQGIFELRRHAEDVMKIIRELEAIK